MKNGINLGQFIIGIITLIVIITGSFFSVRSMAIQTKKDLVEFKIEIRKDIENLEMLQKNTQREIANINLNVILICNKLGIERQVLTKNP